jgi:putative endonuclease
VDRGSWGEAVAERHLRRLRYRVLHRNWRAGRSEVDLIALQEDVLVFVEVKVRSLEDPAGGYGPATAAKKLRSLGRACRAFLATREEHFPHYRFDVVEILTPRRTYRAEKIFHFENVPLFADRPATAC